MSVERVEAPDALMGKPDGPHQFVPELGLEVPTFVDPREDLIPNKAHGFKRLSHHIPFNLRGPYKPEWLPKKFYAMYGHNYRTDAHGYALCFGLNSQGEQCGRQAVNRSPYCPNHGGALHPADKKLSAQNVSIGKIEPERIESLDRVQRFMSGFITVKDLDDDEILGAYVRNDDGRPISNTKLGERFQQEMVKELMSRMQRFIQMKLPNMLKVLADMAESEFVEPADRYKCAVWLAERSLGKVPDVVFHGTTEAPYERMLSLASGSRDEYRRGRIQSTRPDVGPQEILEATVVDDEAELEPSWDNEPGSAGVEGSSPTTNGRVLSNRRDSTERSDSETSGTDQSDSAGNPVDGNGDTKSRAAIAKEAREKLKRAKTRRFAARAQGVVTYGEPAWLIEYRPMKSGGFKAKLWLPEAQTQAVLDKIRAADLAQIGA